MLASIGLIIAVDGAPLLVGDDTAKFVRLCAADHAECRPDKTAECPQNRADPGEVCVLYGAVRRLNRKHGDRQEYRGGSQLDVIQVKSVASAIRPGPNPRATQGRGAFCMRKRFRMNRIVGDDMFP